MCWSAWYSQGDPKREGTCQALSHRFERLGLRSRIQLRLSLKVCAFESIAQPPPRPTHTHTPQVPSENHLSSSLAKAAQEGGWGAGNGHGREGDLREQERKRGSQYTHFDTQGVKGR